MDSTARLLRIASCLLTLMSLGCVVGPDYRPPNTCVPDQWYNDLEGGVYVASHELDQWWTQLNDPILNELIDRAGQRNLDLYSAATRITQARAQLAISRSERLPQVNSLGSFSTIEQSATTTFIGGGVGPGPPSGFGNFLFGGRDLWVYGFDANWELDLFGRVTRLIEASEADWQASVEAYRDVMVTLYAEVAQNYVLVRRFQKQLEYAQRNARSQRDSLALTIRRVEGNISPVLDRYQAESNLASTESTIPPLEVGLHQAMNRLAVLVGEYPQALHEMLSEPQPIPQVPREIFGYLPRDLVRQRPDLRQAERELAASVADIGVATGDLYPQFSLSGTFAVQSRNLSELFRGDSWTHNVGPAFRWAIFQSGRLRNNILFNEAVADGALANYEQKLLLAAEEVENAIIAYTKELERRDALRRTVVASRKSVENVLKLYRGGTTDFQNVLSTERTQFVAEDQLAASEGDVVINLIALYKALGGGWNPGHHCYRRHPHIVCPPTAIEERPPNELPTDAEPVPMRRLPVTTNDE